MKPARTPLVLRWALAWAALTGDYVAISVHTEAPIGAQYRFEVQSRSVRRWIARNDKRRAKRAAQREADLQAKEEAMGVEVFDG